MLRFAVTVTDNTIGVMRIRRSFVFSYENIFILEGRVYRNILF